MKEILKMEKFDEYFKHANAEDIGKAVAINLDYINDYTIVSGKSSNISFISSLIFKEIELRDVIHNVTEKKYFTKIPKNKAFIPGDTLIWDSTETNKYGHVAIYLGTLNNSVIVFEQNGFKQDGAKVTVRGKEKLLGALRKK